MSVLPRTRELEAAPPPLLPFPWKSLEATTRAEVSALREMRRWVARHVRLDAFGLALAALVGADVQVLVGRITRGVARERPRAIDGGIGVVLAPAEDDAPAATALLEVEPALAAAVVARVLRRPPPVAVSVAVSPSATLAGAFAAVVVAAARRGHAGGAPLRVVSAGVAAVVEAEFVRREPDERETLSLSLTVLVGDEAYAARIAIRRAQAFEASPAEWTHRRLASLGALPLSVPIVACATPACVADVASLRPGDAWLPGRWPLEVARGGEALGLRGPVLLAAPDAATGVRARLVDGGRLVLSGEVDAVCPEAEMTERVTAVGEGALLDALVETVGDVPVVVRVEIGEARMAAREWASLGRGDVITVGRRVGELVLLRVGGVAVARGELVNVDGEVGVRIAERIAGDAADLVGAANAANVTNVTGA